MIEIGLWGAIVFAITMACSVSGIVYHDYRHEMGLDKKGDDVRYTYDDQGLIYKL